MNKDRGKLLWSFKNKIVSGLLITMLVFAGLAVLLPTSFEAVGYAMPSDVSWNMDDLVANSSGAVTMGALDEYYVHEDIDISLNSSLTVDPGQTVYFDGGMGFNVYGQLYATGNNVSKITFTSNVSPQSYGDWDGISFYSGSGGSVQYVSVDYAENGILIMDTSLPPISNSEFSYNVWGVRMMAGTCQIYDSTFTSNGILPHPDPFYSNGGGVYADNGSYGYVQYNDFISNLGGIRVRASIIHIIGNLFYNNTVYGIYCEGYDYWNQSYVDIVDNDIIGNENYGIYATFGYYSFIDINNITDNRVGIYVLSSPGTTGGGGSISNNYIAFNWENGIECYGSGNPTDPGIYLSGNDIVSNDIAGIYCENSNPNINNNEITDNHFGVYAYNSTPKIQNCYFDMNDYAVRANLSDVQVIDSEIVSRTAFDYYLENDAYITSLNTTFDDYAVHFADALSILEVQWYLHILVVNASSPVGSADVTISDNENGTWSENYVTDAEGRVKWIVVTEYIRNLLDWVYYTPHNITAVKGSEIGYAEPFMDISKWVIIDLSLGILPPLPPWNLSISLVGSDLELNWGASGDDGTGANDVIGYVIYRADSADGPYVNVSFVPASGLPSYSWLDSGKGDGEWNNYFYMVRAKDEDGLEDDNENKVGKFVSYLVEGWNMISVPLVQSDTARETVLQTIEGNYVTVQGYHAGKSRPWLHWHRGKPNYFNDVIEINHKEGYYIDIITPDHLVIVGKVSPQVEVNLKSGWNLVGYPGLAQRLRDEALSSISGKYNMVERYDTAKNREVRLTPSDYMEPGLGYWIHATQDCKWVITN